MKSEFSVNQVQKTKNKYDFSKINKKNYFELKEMVETAKEPEFGFPKMNNYDSDDDG